MTMDEPETGPGKRPRAGESGAPIGSILSVVLAVVAVAVGLFILQQIDDDDDGVTSPTTPASGSGSADTDASEPSEPEGTTPSEGSQAPPETVVNLRKGAVVVVANANDTGGSAGEMSEQLRVAGFTMGDPVDAAGEEIQLDASKVYFVPGDEAARDIAETLGRILGDVEVAPIPDQLPVDEEDLDGRGRLEGEVLLMLGVAEAGQDLGQLGDG